VSLLFKRCCELSNGLSQLAARHVATTYSVCGREAVMGWKVQNPSYYLSQLEKDNAELLQEFAELAVLRELVRQSEHGPVANGAPRRTINVSDPRSHHR
jgi:hypothetical protein